MSNATETPIDTIDSGHTAWILISMALVQLMLPGLAFFYAGLVSGAVTHPQLWLYFCDSARPRSCAPRR